MSLMNPRSLVAVRNILTNSAMHFFPVASRGLPGSVTDIHADPILLGLGLLDISALYKQDTLMRIICEILHTNKVFLKPLDEMGNDDWKRVETTEYERIPRHVWYALHMLFTDLFNHAILSVVNPSGPGRLDYFYTDTIPDFRDRVGYWWQKTNQKSVEYAGFQPEVQIRDGDKCSITSKPFRENWAGNIKYRKDGSESGIVPQQAHSMARSLGNNPLGLTGLDIIFGREAVDHVVENLHTPKNLINMEANAHADFDRGKFSILCELIEQEGKKGKTPHYTFWRHTVNRTSQLGDIELSDGDKIDFGRGGPCQIMNNMRHFIMKLYFAAKMDPSTDYKNERESLHQYLVKSPVMKIDSNGQLNLVYLDHKIAAAQFDKYQAKSGSKKNDGPGHPGGGKSGLRCKPWLKVYKNFQSGWFPRIWTRERRITSLG
ncbi:hypothetical protein BDV93DRAFT_589974 [Ceratobasidium sp. AG-I]|nr:hypothetical protein BDV93DRAFT_589974 [Ceratobasidium sp. AG-I]